MGEEKALNIQTKNIRGSKKKSVEQVELAEREIKEMSIPYEYDTKEFPIEVVVNKFKNKEIVIPDYQRELEWRPDMKSRFIESLFLGVPIPPIFVAILEEDGRLEIIDGLQRIGTIEEFINNKFKLRNINAISSLIGFSFSDLPESRQRKFKLQTLRFYVVTPKADLAIRADIFDRLNSSGKKLSASQIRKGAFASNEFYQFVIEMSNLDEFNRLFKANKKQNEDHELILRFFAYSEEYEYFKHDVAIFLNRYVENKGREGFSDEDKERKERHFKNMLSFVSKYFPFGFTKGKSKNAIPRVRFEAIAVGTHLALQIKPDLVPKNMDWLNSKEFKRATTSDASNNPGRLAGRVEFVRDCLLGKLENLSY